MKSWFLKIVSAVLHTIMFESSFFEFCFVLITDLFSTLCRMSDTYLLITWKQNGSTFCQQIKSQKFLFSFQRLGNIITLLSPRKTYSEPRP